MDGKGCECFARCEADCVCDADWTPEEVIRLRAEISTAEAFHKVAVAERNYERQRADILESATIKALEDRDRLRAELAELRRFRKAIMDYDSNLYDALTNSDAARKGEGEQ